MAMAAEFIFVHHVQRYTDGAGHRQPFYYYFTTLPVDFLPWTVFSISAAVANIPYRQRASACPRCCLSCRLLWFFVVQRVRY
jgi:4-amino-4-deoxy-L-arabinose transferase-like glycosyltransferase